MIVAFKTYFCDGYAYTVGGVFDTWADDDVCYYVTSKMKCSDSFQGEEPWRQKISCIMQCLSMLGMSISSDTEEELQQQNKIQTIVVDDYVWLEDGKKGLGATLATTIENRYGITDINIVGVTKKPHNEKIDDCCEVEQKDGEKPLYVTCLNPNFAEHYSILVASMEGIDGKPTLLELIDKRAKKMVIKVGNNEDLKIDYDDLDKWAEENLSPKEFNKYIATGSIK